MSDQGRIRRTPTTTDREIADAVRSLHRKGPRLVCELRAEIERLHHEIAVLKTQINASPSRRGAELVEMLRAG